MAPQELSKELKKSGRRLRTWEVQLSAMRYGAISLAAIFVLSLFDFFFAIPRLERGVFWVLLMTLIVLGCRLILKKWRAPMSTESVAAEIERAFPKLDNHLINYLQFERSRNGNEFVKAYLSKETPQLASIDVSNMKDRKEHRNRGLVLGGALLVILLPIFVSTTPWATALWRVVNPFSDIPPVTLTRIIQVTPGNVEVRQGDPLVITCSVEGHPGHKVRIDVEPADDKKTTYYVGRVASGRLESFSHSLPKIATSLKYRVRAGDSPPSAWFSVATRPAIALTRFSCEVIPPAYTRAASRSFDGLVDDLEALEGSDVSLSLVCNQPLSHAKIRPGTQKRIRLVSTDEGYTWTGSFIARSDATLAYSASNPHGESIEGTLALKVHPDRAPEITILHPLGRALLKMGVEPTVSFVADDDYELADVRVERIDLDPAKDGEGIRLEVWQPTGRRILEKSWSGAGEPMRDTTELAYQVVATDASPLGQRVTRSPLILFDTPADREASDAERKRYARSAVTLKHIVDLQERNLDATRELAKSLDSETAEQWRTSVDRQEDIRRLARILIVSPAQSLGSLAPAMKRLYNEEMLDVIGELKRVPTLTGETKQRTAAHAVALEKKILRRLSLVTDAVAATDKRRQVSEILAALEALIDGETEIISTTENISGKSLTVHASLIDRQDDLAFDVSDFVSACHERAATLKQNNAKFAELVRQVAARCESDKVKTDMLHAAEELEQNQPGDALPHERTALGKLSALQAILKKWQVSVAEEGLEHLLDTLGETRGKIEKIRKLQEKLLATMEQIKPNLNKGSKEADRFEAELDEMQKQLMEAALKIPVDLHIFSEMTVANELVEDIASVFELVAQRKGSETESADIAEEVGHLKPEAFIEIMKKAEERFDELEMWLRDDPEEWDFNNEAFDQEEMEQMAMVELPTSIEDIIGDLLEETAALDRESGDSASNQGVPDLESGWEISEGPTVSHAAKGKSGNQKPDHKEQDGRSLVGRQGMSQGETAAGGGTISEGDKDIEARRTTDPTQSGHVQTEGEADEKATGGGKQGSGASDDYGMTGKGGDQRMDSTGAGSWDGLADLMAKTEAVHIKASLLNLRTESLGAAAHHMKQADDAIAQGLPIHAVRKHHRRALQALKASQTELKAGVSAGVSSSAIEGSPIAATLSSSDEAPEEYRDLVAEYFRSLSETL
jgi:hypothetical protein